jgi:hypothetical protein
MEKKIQRRKEQIKALERQGIDEVGSSNKPARCFLTSGPTAVVLSRATFPRLTPVRIPQFNTCEENTALLEDTYADNGIKKPK